VLLWTNRLKVEQKRGKVLRPWRWEFTEDYPSKPPKVSFPQGFFHPNIYPSGRVLHSFTFQLNVSAFSGTGGGALRGCLGGV
jgi:hypothetical protein